MKRRQEILFSSPGAVVVDDFAHHPTAVAITIEAFREVYPNHTLVAVFEPRTNTSRTKRFQEDYIQSLEWADKVFLLEPAGLDRIPEEERIDCCMMAEALVDHGVKAARCSDTATIMEKILEDLPRPAVILCMSNGPMEDLPHRLAEHFKKNP